MCSGRTPGLVCGAASAIRFSSLSWSEQVDVAVCGTLAAGDTVVSISRFGGPSCAEPGTDAGASSVSSSLCAAGLLEANSKAVFLDPNPWSPVTPAASKVAPSNRSYRLRRSPRADSLPLGRSVVVRFMPRDAHAACSSGDSLASRALAIGLSLAAKSAADIASDFDLSGNVVRRERSTSDSLPQVAVAGDGSLAIHSVVVSAVACAAKELANAGLYCRSLSSAFAPSV